jgi:hypothetical protein
MLIFFLRKKICIIVKKDNYSNGNVTHTNKKAQSKLVEKKSETKTGRKCVHHISKLN